MTNTNAPPTLPATIPVLELAISAKKVTILLNLLCSCMKRFYLKKNGLKREFNI